MPRSINPVPQYFDGENKILDGGQMFYFDSGTSTPKTTFSDEQETTPNTHPVILDAEGRLPPVFFTGSAKQVLKTKPTILNPDGTQIWERDPVGSTVTIGDFIEWNNEIDYGVGEIVKYAGKFYISIQTPNQDQEPVSDSEYWAEIRFLSVWNPNVDYPVGVVVQTTDGNQWKSIQTPNVNQDPLTDDAGEYWAVSYLNKWVSNAAAFSVVRNKRYQIDASSGVVEASFKAAYEAGDELVIHNESISTNVVRITNTALTIKGINGEITPTDDLTISAGDTAYIVMKTPTEGEFV